MLSIIYFGIKWIYFIVTVKLQNNLKRLRFNKNSITQLELAKQLDVSRQTIIAIEQGKFNPSVKLALGLASFFECSVEDIFFVNKIEK